MTRFLAVAEGATSHWNFHVDVGTEDSIRAVSIGSQGVPSPRAIADVDRLLVVGPLPSHDAARQLGGTCRLAIERGIVAVCLFPVRLDGPDAAFVNEVVGGRAASQPSAFRVESASDSFYDYFGVFGLSASWFEGFEDAEVLGTIEEGPAALMMPVQQGRFYLLPYHVANLPLSHGALIDSAIRAVDAHQAGGQVAIPAFLDQIRVPGEEELLEEVAELRGRLDTAQAEVDRLAQFKALIGTSSGDTLERLVIESLNVVLAGSEHQAEDRQDIGAEDFWIVGPNGDYALAEAKGIGSHVRRIDVNQVENHRAELERDVDDVPGLLIINVFRGSDELDQRCLPVSEDVQRHAQRLNVLVLRTWDLFNLLKRKLAGDDVSGVLPEALASGGGWLEVTDDGHHLHTG